jgi:hypothetical protein
MANNGMVILETIFGIARRRIREFNNFWFLENAKMQVFILGKKMIQLKCRNL